MERRHGHCAFQATPVISHPYDNYPSASQPASITGAISNHCTSASPGCRFDENDDR